MTCVVGGVGRVVRSMMCLLCGGRCLGSRAMGALAAARCVPGRCCLLAWQELKNPLANEGKDAAEPSFAAVPLNVSQ